MREEARSLNLSNAVAITAFEALRQTGFSGLLDHGNLKK
jgi:tRNA (cytidine/uridine-2'-O-)-methyltransferase